LVITLADEARIIFAPFCLDRSNECLWKGQQVIKLRPKAYAVLNHLIGRCGQLVTKEELLTTVWPETFVGDAVLKVTIRQLREVLDDDPRAPLFIETAHRRGYRFIGRITDPRHVPAKAEEVTGESSISTLQREVDPPLGFVGRDEALARMRSWCETIHRGKPEIVFVTGEAGIGKTALVDTFTHYIAYDQSFWIGRGQCLEQYGSSEAYLPILEAIGHLCREQSQMVDVLRTHAPLWLLQMPSLLSASEREALSREMIGATPERMMREMAEALEVLTSEQPLVLILEDLHWSDCSTLDLISYLARQRRAAHMMIIGTYRPVELIVSGHPLKAVKQELLAKHQCEELALADLNEDAIAKYLSIRFPDNRFPSDLAELIHERTEGNPLFMVNAVEYLLTERLIMKQEGIWELVAGIEKVEVGVPESIKQMIEKQVDKLDPTAQRTLEVASVAGAEFSTLAVAAGLEDDHNNVEVLCEHLARQRQFIQACGFQVLPNGEVVSRYGFIHALYQNVLYDRVSPSRCVQFHRRIGERGEEVYGECAREIAAELAMHFERGHDYKRAANYFKQAADNAIRRFAYREAVGLARRGLETLMRLPEGVERAQQELSLQLTLGVPLMATEGYAAPNVGRTYQRARQLFQQLGETPEVAEVLWGLWVFHIVRADLETACEIGNEFLRLAEELPSPALAMRGHLALEVTFVDMGEFGQSVEHFEKALSFYDHERHREDALSYSQNSGVALHSHCARALWILGQPDQALRRMQEALTLARELSEPHGLAHSFYFASILHLLRGEERIAQEHAEAAIAVSSEHGLPLYQAMSMIILGSTLFDLGSQEEGIAEMRLGLAAYKATGTQIARPQFLALLAEALGRMAQFEEGLCLIEEAIQLAQSRHEHCYLAELYRSKGELLFMQAGDQELSEACFQESLKIGRQQQAKSWVLRASISLARLYQNRRRHEKALDLIRPVYESFTEGFDTLDLREAQSLLDELTTGTLL
jgi:predicted ATPase